MNLCSYLVMPFMGTDLGKLMKMQRLSEEKIQYLVYQILKGLKVATSTRKLTLQIQDCRDSDLNLYKPLAFLFRCSIFILLASFTG